MVYFTHNPFGRYAGRNSRNERNENRYAIENENRRG